MTEGVQDVPPAPIEIRSPNSQVYLREFVPEDAQELFELFDKNRSFLSEHYVPTNYKNVKDILKSVDFDRKEGAIRFCVKNNENKIIGSCFIKPFTKESEEAEIGYWLGEEYIGKGNGSQAIRLLCSFGFEKLNIKKIQAVARKDNVNSQNALKSCGFQESDISPLFQRPSERYFYYSLTPSELKLSHPPGL